MRRNFLTFLAALIVMTMLVLAIQSYADRLAHGATNQCAALENTLGDLIEATAGQAGFQVGVAMRMAGYSQLSIEVIAARMQAPRVKALSRSKWGEKITAKREAVLLFAGCR